MTPFKAVHQLRSMFEASQLSHVTRYLNGNLCFDKNAVAFHALEVSRRHCLRNRLTRRSNTFFHFVRIVNDFRIFTDEHQGGQIANVVLSCKIQSRFFGGIDIGACKMLFDKPGFHRLALDAGVAVEK